jgi:Tfp pilus assembly protein PilN
VTTQTDQVVGIAALPRVNLMPPEIAEAARFRRLQLAMGGAVVVSGVLVAGLYTHAKSGVSTAQVAVTEAQTQQVSLQAKLTSLASVEQTQATVAAKQALLQQAMGQEIRWSYVLNDLSYRIPNQVWLTGVTASETAASPNGAASVPTEPGTTLTGLGTVTFSGVAFDHDDVANWLDSMAKEKGFAQPTFSSSTESAIGTRSVVDFGSTVVVDQNALSNRYVTKAGN